MVQVRAVYGISVCLAPSSYATSVYALPLRPCEPSAVTRPLDPHAVGPEVQSYSPYTTTSQRGAIPPDYIQYHPLFSNLGSRSRPILVSDSAPIRPGLRSHGKPQAERYVPLSRRTTGPPIGLDVPQVVLKLACAAHP